MELSNSAQFLQAQQIKRFPRQGRGTPAKEAGHCTHTVALERCSVPLNPSLAIHPASSPHGNQLRHVPPPWLPPTPAGPTDLITPSPTVLCRVGGTGALCSREQRPPTGSGGKPAKKSLAGPNGARGRRKEVIARFWPRRKRKKPLEWLKKEEEKAGWHAALKTLALT